MENYIEEVLISEEMIKERTRELGIILSKEYQGKTPLMIGILKGAVLFMSDLIRNMDINIEIDFMTISSYGDSTQSSGIVKILKDLDTTIENRDIIIVEDIIDRGLTLGYLIELLKRRNVNSIKIVTLLDKFRNRNIDFKIDYTGFTVPDKFVVGYGLDYKGLYRNLPYIGVLKPEVYIK